MTVLELRQSALRFRIIREADDAIKPGVSGANPGRRAAHTPLSPRSGRRLVDIHGNQMEFDEAWFGLGPRPLRGLNIPGRLFPGVRYAHPGLYAAVRSADSLAVGNKD